MTHPEVPIRCGGNGVGVGDPDVLHPGGAEIPQEDPEENPAFPFPAVILAYSQVGAVVVERLNPGAAVVIVAVLAGLRADLDGVGQHRARRRTALYFQRNTDVVIVAAIQRADVPDHIVGGDHSRRDRWLAVFGPAPGSAEGGAHGQRVGDQHIFHGHVAIVAIANLITDLPAGHQLAPLQLLVDVQIGVWLAHPTIPEGLVVVILQVVAGADDGGVGDLHARPGVLIQVNAQADVAAPPAGNRRAGDHQLMAVTVYFHPAKVLTPPGLQGGREMERIGEDNLATGGGAVVADADVVDKVVPGGWVTGPGPLAHVQMGVVGLDVAAPLGVLLPLFTLIVGVAGGDLHGVGDGVGFDRRHLHEDVELA